MLLKNKKYSQINKKSGMSYIELIVVLSIFSVLSGVVIYNYGDFQSKVDIKNLSSEIGLKIVEAQKSSLSGLLPQVSVSPTWKPSYGVYFNFNDKGLSQNGFIYFTDLDSNGFFDGGNCTGECLEKITIGKGNIVSGINVFYSSGGVKRMGAEDSKGTPIEDLTVSFSRPSSGAIINTNAGFTSAVSFVQIIVTSPKSTTSQINIYPSGRIEVI